MIKVILFADTNLTESGEYVFYSRELGRCDSITILKLTLGNNVKPVIQVNERILSTATSYKTYQWMLNGSLISRANNTTYTVFENGDYQVIVSHENGCIDTSDIYKVRNVNSIHNHPQYNSVHVYPNPASKILFIKSQYALSIRLAAIDGKILISEGHVNSIYLSKLSPGLYLAYLYDNQGLLIKVTKVFKK